MERYIPALDEEFKLVSGLHDTRAMFMWDGPRGRASLFLVDISAIRTLLGGRIDYIGDDGLGQYRYKISYNPGMGMLVSYALQASNILDIVSSIAEPIEKDAELDNIHPNDLTQGVGYIPMLAEPFFLLSGDQKIESIFLKRRDGNLVLCTNEPIFALGYFTNFSAALSDFAKGMKYKYHITFYPKGMFTYEKEVERIFEDTYSTGIKL